MLWQIGKRLTAFFHNLWAWDDWSVRTDRSVKCSSTLQWAWCSARTPGNSVRIHSWASLPWCGSWVVNLNQKKKKEKKRNLNLKGKALNWPPGGKEMVIGIWQAAVCWPERQIILSSHLSSFSRPLVFFVLFFFPRCRWRWWCCHSK